jgi:hypothetical protein
MKSIYAKNYSLHVDEEHKVIYTTVKGFMRSAELWEMLDSKMKLIRSYNITTLLNDFKRLDAVSPIDQQKISSDWFMKAEKSGIKRIGYVVPEQLFGKVALKRTIDSSKFETPIEIKLFTDVDFAEKWVKNTDIN